MCFKFFLVTNLAYMRKIYYLASCDTCRKIIKALPSNANLEFHDIRQNPIAIAELEFMHQLSGSYEALFSKKAQLYKEKGLKNLSLTEADYKKWLSEQVPQYYSVFPDKKPKTAQSDTAKAATMPSIATTTATPSSKYLF